MNESSVLKSLNIVIFINTKIFKNWFRFRVIQNSWFISYSQEVSWHFHNWHLYFDNHRNEKNHALIKTVHIFKALSDKNRIRILKMLEYKPLCVCEITQVLGLAASTTSKHLSILKNAQLIFEQKENKWVNYYLNSTSQNQYVKQILPLIKTWMDNDKIVQSDRIRVEKVDRANLCSG